MTVDLIKFAYIAGEVSPSFLGRTDLEKYDLGMAQVDNWFIDYRGGLTTRAGFEFSDYVMNDDKPTKFIKFAFAPDVANTNVILFGHFYVRFLQDGAYVLEAAKNVTGVTQATPGVMTAVAHGFNNGDWVKPSGIGGMVDLNNQTYVVKNKTVDTFELTDVYGNNINTSIFDAYTAGGTVARVYTLASPYDSIDLDNLRFHQIRDTLRLTHPNYAIRNLTRTASANWTLALESIENTVSIPQNVAITHSGGTGASVAFCVTAVFEDGTESLASDWGMLFNCVNITTTAGVYDVTWTPVTDAKYYNVYRTRVSPNGNTLSRAMQMGFVGRTTGAYFNDANIIPDFARSPPLDDNPFADGAVTQVNVTNQGSNYASTTTLTVVGTGTGAKVYPVIATSSSSNVGPIVGVMIVAGGKGYTGTPTITVGTPGGGSGATFSVKVGPTGGNNPYTGTVFQQREVYGATDNSPLGIFGSRPGRLSNFGTSEVVLASDSFEFEIDAEDVSAIRHLVTTRGGLLVVNQSGIWQLAGAQGAALTPTNALAEPHSYKGATKLPPIKIDTDLLYAEPNAIRLLSYDDRLKVYSGTDVSILSNHLIAEDKQVTAWGYADEPFKTVWARRSDGECINFTILKEQNVFAWSRAHTRGLFDDVITIREGVVDRTYFMIRRFIGGRWRKYIEVMAERRVSHSEEAFCVDAGLRLGSTTMNSNLRIAAATGNDVAVTADIATFAPGDVGKIIRAGGGKMRVLSYTSNLSVQVKILRDVTAIFTEDGTPKPVPAGYWTMDTPVSTFRGLYHLEGETVNIVADGSVQTPQVVTNGKITLPVAATRVSIGLGYMCIAQTLPPIVPGAVIEASRKRIVGAAIRLSESRGMKSGPDLAHLKPIKTRTNELWGEPTRSLNGIHVLMIDPEWNEEGQTYFVQDAPLPATILGHVVQADVGDNESKD